LARVYLPSCRACCCPAVQDLSKHTRRLKHSAFSVTNAQQCSNEAANTLMGCCMQASIRCSPSVHAVMASGACFHVKTRLVLLTTWCSAAHAGCCGSWAIAED
jgi:hypothetical protein